ncbi:BREX-3 system P-loop-containing protein BrxF [bacterium]|nr:BREX-3 system P-loop-containing protein BrxF [bacterium]
MSMIPAQKILKALKEAEYLYHRLVFLVGGVGSGKTTILQDVSRHLDVQFINTNLELSKLLIEMTGKQQTLQLPKLLENLVNCDEKDIILDNIEILFDVTLQQDPLRLLQTISRNRNIVVSWNGFVENGKLIYAEPGHPEHRSYDATNLSIISLN